jgi:hypothetical protein
MDVDNNLITMKLTSWPILTWMDFIHFSYTMNEFHPTSTCTFVTKREGPMETNNDCTICCGPWRPCSSNRFHTYWPLNLFWTRTVCILSLTHHNPKINRHNNTICPTKLEHWCNSKKLLYLIHRICTSPRAQAIPAITSSQKKKKGLIVPQCLVLSL